MHGRTAARAILRRPAARHAPQPFPQQLDALRDQAPVGLELRLARTAQPDAALLPLEVRPAADEARRHVVELRELDLQLALGAACALREDVEDQAHAVDDAAFQRLLEVALLHAGQRMIEDHEVGGRFAALRGDLVDLAATGEERGIRPRAPPAAVADDGGAGRGGERCDLRQALAMTGAPEIQRDDQRLVTRGGSIEHASADARLPSAARAASDGGRPAARIPGRRQLSLSWWF